MMFPNNASPITSKQLKIVEKMLVDEAPSALFPFEKDIMRQEQYVSKWTGKIFPARQNTIKHVRKWNFGHNDIPTK